MVSLAHKRWGEKDQKEEEEKKRKRKEGREGGRRTDGSYNAIIPPPLPSSLPHDEICIRPKSEHVRVRFFLLPFLSLSLALTSETYSCSVWQLAPRWTALSLFTPLAMTISAQSHCGNLVFICGEATQVNGL